MKDTPERTRRGERGVDAETPSALRNVGNDNRGNGFHMVRERGGRETLTVL